MSIEQIEAELKKLLNLPPWGQKQSNDWDKLSNFVYSTPAYEEFVSKLNQLNLSEAFKNYATNRWFNTWSARGVEKIFCTNSNVIANTNKYDKLVDFRINGISFDHKTSVFPRGFGKDLAYAQQNPRELIHWLYAQQSKENRYHTDNRLFIVLHKQNEKHWQLKKELSWLRPIINNYVANFNPAKLHTLEIENGKKTYSDIIWAVA